MRAHVLTPASSHGLDRAPGTSAAYLSLGGRGGAGCSRLECFLPGPERGGWGGLPYSPAFCP